jgi:hypothetical protein
VFNGDSDYFVNWIGTEKLLKQLNWYGNEEFNYFNGGNFKKWHYHNVTSNSEHLAGE